MKYEEFYQDIYNNNISMDTRSSSVSFQILSAIEQVLFELLSRIKRCKHPSVFDILASSNKQTLIPDKEENNTPRWSYKSGSKTHLIDRLKLLNFLLSLQVIKPFLVPSPKFRTSAKLLPDHSCSHSTAYLLQNTGCLQTDNKGEVIICILSNFIKHFILITT